MFQGSSTELDTVVQNLFGQDGAVVMHFIERLERNRHYLYFDNYFISYNLLSVLADRHIYAAGTVRVNRFAKPPLITDKCLPKMGRETSYEVFGISEGQKSQIGLIKWFDNKGVVLCSNFITSGEPETIKCWDKKHKQFVDVERPEVIGLYNKSMGGVDVHDQLAQSAANLQIYDNVSSKEVLSFLIGSNILHFFVNCFVSKLPKDMSLYYTVYEIRYRNVKLCKNESKIYVCKIVPSLQAQIDHRIGWKEVVLHDKIRYKRITEITTGALYIYIPIMYMAALGYVSTYINTVVHRTTTRPTWRSYRLISILNFFLLDRFKKTNWSTINVTGSRVRVCLNFQTTCIFHDVLQVGVVALHGFLYVMSIINSNSYLGSLEFKNSTSMLAQS
ncbi:hypothetical protein QTP88_010593 [Uroleucon formosanum]